jgi:hypothetical protein
MFFLREKRGLPLIKPETSFDVPKGKLIEQAFFLTDQHQEHQFS